MQRMHTRPRVYALCVTYWCGRSSSSGQDQRPPLDSTLCAHIYICGNQRGLFVFRVGIRMCAARAGIATDASTHIHWCALLQCRHINTLTCNRIVDSCFVYILKRSLATNFRESSTIYALWSGFLLRSGGGYSSKAKESVYSLYFPLFYWMCVRYTWPLLDDAVNF